ncbi:MAG: site-specific DNA-methyltransferase [Candidatus Omnitrophica bacterium]|nr:site-specific DNA-methyltransferase [Candidatus Omnitrophota bacterium]
MKELKDNSIDLVVTSPPYYNAPFDFPGMFKSYEEFLQLMKDVAKELLRVMKQGRIVCLVTDDMLVNGVKYPIIADITKIFMEAGFRYRDKIIWRKPEGYIRISRRSGVTIQHPFPMYFYPDNLKEEIIIFQKGEYDYKSNNSNKEKSKIDIKEFQKNKWYLTVWDITNVLPAAKEAKFTAVFPDEIPNRLIKLFSFVGDTILDPFLGSGTTMKVARKLGRNSVGYEIDLELEKVIKEKVGYNLVGGNGFEIIKREDAKKLRTNLNKQINETLAKNYKKVNSR